MNKIIFLFYRLKVLYLYKKLICLRLYCLLLGCKLFGNIDIILIFILCFVFRIMFGF